MRIIKIKLIVISCIITFLSCEKEPPVFDEKLGYFKGSFNGKVYASEKPDSIYVPNIQYGRYTSCDIKSYLGFHFIKKGASEPAYEQFSTSFYVDKIDKIDGDKYKKFADVFDVQGDINNYCEEAPVAFQGLGRNYGFYKHVHTKDTYLKINKVTETYVMGSFDVLFVSRDFLEKGIKSGQDSMRVKCEKFVAIIY
jgi:hypothetical protein